LGWIPSTAQKKGKKKKKREKKKKSKRKLKKGEKENKKEFGIFSEYQGGQRVFKWIEQGRIVR
jgi:hypothetical protein